MRKNAQNKIDRRANKWHLLEEVVETRCPLAGTKTSGPRAVIHHEGNSLGMHVWTKGINSLDHL
jgi:hypothetical protein